MSKRLRCGNYFVFPSEFDSLLWRSGTTTQRAAKILGRTTRTIRDWRAGNRPVPRWAFRLVQLLQLQSYDQWRVLPHIWIYPGDADIRRQVFGPARNDACYPQEEGLSGGGDSGSFPSEKAEIEQSASDLLLNRQAQRPPARCAARQPLDRRTSSDPAPGYPQAGIARASEARLAGPWITLPDLRRAA